MCKTLIPDQPHIDEISKRLWSGREIGKAAVMIGAGFSRNASPTIATAPKLPLLEDIAVEMFEMLYPQDSMPEAKRTQLKSQTTTGTAIMNLASEFEIVFGRQALDELLIQSVSDDRYVPGEVHELLLSLPWSDVFTTNYDTLLERTRPRIHNRKYDLIHQPSDIPAKMKPRIVKLHGTFPSHRPFIITDEDYRTFPRLFPPFVNIVQQSIMENAFCLIGFSGNDANFIYWSGWVRDHLGHSAAPIYLCGLLNLTVPQKRLLESRRVIPIDLTPVVAGIEAHDEQLKHRVAIEWFLRYLRNGEPISRNAWPRHVKRKAWNSGFDLPSISPVESREETEKFNASPLSALDDATARRLSSCWARERESYPGWIVLPYYKRIALWSDTETFSPRIIKALSDLQCPHNLFLAYELNWRAERCLTPIADDWASAFDSVVNSINPFPQSISALTCPANPDSEEHSSLPWERISECWVELAFALVRKAREDQNERSFQHWIELLRSIATFKNDWESQWYYEQVLFSVMQFDQSNALRLLEEWPTQQSSFWEARRAALLAELGQVAKARSIAEQLLSDVRAGIQPYVTDYALLTQEAWLMLQLFTEDRPRSDEGSQRLQLRWDELKVYEIDPWFERNALQSEIQIIANEAKAGQHETIDFDPMNRTSDLHFGPSLIDKRMDAFTYLRLFEDGAIPMRVGSLHMASEEGAIAGRLIYPFSPFWALSAMVRSDKDAILSRWFDRVRVASLTDVEVDRFSKLLTKALREAATAVSVDPRQALDGETFLTQNLETFCELVSRLSFRLSDQDLESLLMFCIEMYKSSALRQHSYVYRKTIDLLLKRITYALPRSILLQRLGLLLELPVATEPGFENENPALVKDPFEELKWPKELTINETFDRSTWTAPIAHLINLVKHGSDIARERAIHRLLFINEINALTDLETIAFREALWFRLDEKDLPANSNMHLWALLRYPPPNSDDFRTSLQQRVLDDWSHRDPHYFEALIEATASPRSSRERPLQLFSWTEAQALKFLEEAKEWWAKQKSEIAAEKASGRIDLWDRRAERVSTLITFLGKVILPNLRSASEPQKASVLSLVTDIESSGYPTLLVRPLTLFVDPERLDKTAELLRTALTSTNDNEARYAIFGLYWWLLYGSKDTLPGPPMDLILELANKIAMRREPALLSAMLQTALIIDQMPDILFTSMVESLCRGLEYLLTDTELPTEKDRAEMAGVHTTIRVEDRPDYRAGAAGLAAALHRHFRDTSRDIPEVLAKWQQVAETDTLPEVRLAWHERQ